MASLEKREGGKKISYRILFYLYNHPTKKNWKVRYSVKQEEDANSFIPLFELISNKSFSNTASSHEVDSWVQSGYLKLEDACIAFPLYGETRKAQNRGTSTVDWKSIEEEYAKLKIRKSNNKDRTSVNHTKKMAKFRQVSKWLRDTYPNLNPTSSDIQDWLDEKRQNGMKASTRKQDLMALDKIFFIMQKLRMKADNPVEIDSATKEKLQVRVPRRTGYIKRILLEKHEAEKLLRLPLADITTGTERKEHPLCRVNIKELQKLPDVIGREEVLDALLISNSSYKRYVTKGLLPQPSRGKKDGHARNFIAKDDLIEKIKQVIKDQTPIQVQTLPPRYQTMRGAFPLALRIGVWCGLRNGEVVWLPWDHVDLDKGLLHVKKVISPLNVTWTPKSVIDQQEESTLERTLEINTDLVKYFEFEKRRQEGLGIQTFFVFPSGQPQSPVEHGKPLTSSILNKAFQKYLTRANIPHKKGLTFYSLRHTYCTELLRRNVNIENVRYRMGHTDLKTTQTYLHPEFAESRLGDRLLDFVSDSDVNNLMLDFVSDETPQQSQ